MAETNRAVLAALSHYKAGRMEAAEAACREALAADPKCAAALHTLGRIAFGREDRDAARHYLSAASAAGSSEPTLHHDLGIVLQATGDVDGAVMAFERAAALDPEGAQSLRSLGLTLREAGRYAEAFAAFARARDRAPDDLVIAQDLREVVGFVVPPWHAPMMNDGARNDAYEAAIRRHALGKRVLDIGTGAGLLALMAARASAARVDSCEMVPEVAAMARTIVAANGLSDRVTVVAKPSYDAVVGLDLPARAEVLITETFSTSLLTESVLPTVEDAWARLLTRDAVAIPRAAAAMGHLVGGEVLERSLRVGTISGFDFSAFNDFVPAFIGIDLDRTPHAVLSEDVELLRIDLTARKFPPEARVVEAVATGTGRAIGIGQWVRIELDAQSTYDNRPRGAAEGQAWMHILHIFPEPVEVTPGRRLPIQVWHDRRNIHVALAPGASGLR